MHFIFDLVALPPVISLPSPLSPLLLPTLLPPRHQMASLADLPLPRLLQELRNMGIPHDALDKLSATEEGIRTLRGLFKPGGPFQSAPKASSNDELSSDVFRSALDGAKARYDKEKDMKPTKQVLAPRQMILEAANTARNKIQPTKGTGETMQVISIAGVPKNFSTTPLDRLERAAIKDLFTYKVHKVSNRNLFSSSRTHRSSNRVNTSC